MMEKNVGQIDKIIRVILGIIFLILAYVTYGDQLILAVIFVILAVIMFVTAALGTCPIWSVLKVNTNKA